MPSAVSTSAAGSFARDHAPYAICGLAALGLRVAALDRVPLDWTEAASAWTAWGAASGGGSPLPLLERPPESAALFGLQCALFWLAGAGDVLARLSPALAGAAVVAAPWLLRHVLGRTTSVSLAVLIAIDPTMVGYSRLADGAMLAASASWFVFAGLLALTDTQASPPATRAWWLRGMAVAAGGVLASGPLAWDLFPPLVGGALLVTARTHESSFFITRHHAALAATTALLLATSALMQWEGPALVSAGVGGWLRGWTESSGTSFTGLWAWILRYEMLSVTLGLAGLVVAWSRRWSPFLLGWLVWGCLLTLRPGRSAAAWLVIAPPLLLLAAWGGAWLAESLRSPATRRLAALPSYVAAAATLILLARLVHGAFDIGSGQSEPAFRAYSSRTEPGIRLLAQDVAAIEHRAAFEEGRRPIEVVTRGWVDPVLAWYLRREEPLRWVAAPSPIAEGAGLLVIEPVDDESNELTRVYALRQVGLALERVRLR